MDLTLNSLQLVAALLFLVTAVGTLIGMLAMRLGRIVDRLRALDQNFQADTVSDPEAADVERKQSRLRGLVVTVGLALLTVSAGLIGLTVLSLFLGGMTGLNTQATIPWTFVGGALTFVLALPCFLFDQFLESRAQKLAPPDPER